MFKDTKYYEGLRLHVYTDTTGHKTIGYGHNLDGGSDEGLKAIGMDPIALRNGTIDLTKDGANLLYNYDIGIARKNLKILGFVVLKDDFSPLISAILLDLMFNMGLNTFSQFKRTIQAFKNKNYLEAADDLEESVWYSQVGQRSRDICETLRSL